MSEKKGIFNIFRKKEDEELKEAEARVEELEEELREKAKEEAREKARAEIREQHEVRVEADKEEAAEKIQKHVVESGESLSVIAKKYYDDAGKYLKIYEANKDVIGDDPNLIQPGMELVIPEL